MSERVKGAGSTFQDGAKNVELFFFFFFRKGRSRDVSCRGDEVEEYYLRGQTRVDVFLERERGKDALSERLRGGRILQFEWQGNVFERQQGQEKRGMKQMRIS